jgi:fructose-1,6-bisphosphatase/inositol monophosphatase family enzyme
MSEFSSTTARGDLTDAVADALERVSAEHDEPRFERLAPGDIEEKSTGELVTVADRAAEEALERELRRLCPEAMVVGEEGCAAAPERLHDVDADLCWLIDPLDGTRNFIAGSPDWALMVALLRRGETLRSWIWQPLAQRMYIAERGSGATCNGIALRPIARARDAAGLRGTALTGFMPPAAAAAVERNRDLFAEVGSERRCSGMRYPAIVEGAEDFAIFWRTLPWDHAPGALLLEETGGCARRPNGDRYVPGVRGSGLVLVADPSSFDAVMALLA